MERGVLTARQRPNRLRVVDALRQDGRLSRADIARATGLSRSTITTLVGELVDLGVVVEAPCEDARIAQGRPPILLQLDPAAGLAVGVDFDHDHVLVLVADLGREVLAERRAEADVDRDAPGAIELAADLVDAALADAGAEASRVLGLGVALAGPVDQLDGTVLDSRILPAWAGVRVAEELTARVGVPVHVDNDANLGAFAELTLGAARGAGTAVYLQLSSGVGAGLIVDGRPFRGANGLAGEIGHYAVEASGPICRCGSRGCLETVASGPAIAALVSASYHEPLTIEDVIRLALDGDLGARRAIADGAGVVGRVIGNLCHTINPDTVVIGGLLAEAGDLYLDPLRDAVERVALPEMSDRLKIVTGELGHRANALGAVALAISQSDHAVAELVSNAADHHHTS